MVATIGGDDEIVLASLFHDIGHFCVREREKMISSTGVDFGVAEHERVGGEFLERLNFSDRVTRLVAGHVLAKRYSHCHSVFCCIRPSHYFLLLADISHGRTQTTTPSFHQLPKRLWLVRSERRPTPDFTM